MRQVLQCCRKNGRGIRGGWARSRIHFRGGFHQHERVFLDSVHHPLPYCTPLLLVATVHCNHLSRSLSICARVYVCVAFGAVKTRPLVLPPPRPGALATAASALVARRHGQESARVSFQPFFDQQHRGVFAPRAAALVATARAGICRAELQSSIHWPLMELSRHRPSCWLEIGLAGRLGPPSALVRAW